MSEHNERHDSLDLELVPYTHNHDACKVLNKAILRTQFAGKTKTPTTAWMEDLKKF